MSTREQRHWEHLQANKVTRQILKHQNTTSDPGQTRRRDWVTEYLKDPEFFEETDLPGQERVMPRGEKERRQGKWVRALEELERGYELTSEPPSVPPNAEGRGTNPTVGGSLARGTVIELGPGTCRVETSGGVVTCGLRATVRAPEQVYTNVAAVGDQVMISLQRSGQGADGSAALGVVEEVLPRRSALVRPDVFYPHLQQVIAANVDQLLIVASWRDPALWPELVDRYLIAAERNRLAPIICINKVDLTRNGDEPRLAMEPYERLRYRVLFTSARNGEGLPELAEILAVGITALAGLSGVGKSSLLSAVEPGLELRVREVSARRHEGQHTTTQVKLHHLRAGGCVVDTPGIREFGLSGLCRQELAAFYPEFSAVACACQFADCSHVNEPGCAVHLAVRAGRIAAVRYENYLKIRQSLPAQ